MQPYPLLEIKNLGIDFITNAGRVRAVDQLNLVLQKGQTLGIVGESGSGKSVTALSVMRLLNFAASTPTGEIWFSENGSDKINLLTTSDQAMQNIRGNRIGIIFQEPMTSLNPVQKCGWQVCESMMFHHKVSYSEARLQALALFNEVLLPRPDIVFKSYPHQLSGGQKQRVMIAMAVACNPALLIADEPTTALDATVQKSILALMKRLQQKYQMAMLFISHDLGVVAQVAEMVAVLYQGRVVEYGPTDQVFHHPEHPYTKGLIACRPGLTGHPTRLPVVADFIEKNIGEKPKEFVYTSSEQRGELHKHIYDKDALIKVKNLSVHFAESGSWFRKGKTYLKAVDAVSFDVYQGETLGLVGESGSGKTTLGMAMLRLVKPNHGQIVYDGNDLQRLRERDLRLLRRNMQIIFQDPYSSLNPRITIGCAIAEPMYVHGLYGSDKLRKQKAMELLERVGLQAAHHHRYPHEFSGGQRQRVCIARALALNPRFIICDESVSSLDVSIQAQVLNLLNDLKKEFGITFVFISHDLSVVRYMSDRIMVMKNGKIVEIGETDSVISNPQNDYTRLLIDAIPKVLSI